MKNVKAVTLAEAAVKLTNLAEHAPEHLERRLAVRIHSPGGIGGTPTVDVTGIHVGIGFDSGKIILHTDHALTKLTAEQVAAVMESVRQGQSWHALEQYREMRQILDAVKDERDKMGRALKAIADGFGLQDYYPTREQAPDANLAELVLQKAKAGLDAIKQQEQLAEAMYKLPIGPASVVRDERGLWRHPAYPRFGVGEEAAKRYANWFKAQGLTYTTNYMLAPEDVDLIPDDYSNWDLVQPHGDGWFLLAIEEFVDDPVCVWGWRQPANAGLERTKA